MLVQAGGTVKEEVCRSLVVLLTNAPELHGYAARAFFRALRDAPARPPPLLLATTAAWFLGARALGRRAGHLLWLRSTQVGCASETCVLAPGP